MGEALESHWNVDAWVESVGLHGAVADALRPPDGVAAFEYIRSMSSGDLMRHLETHGLGVLHGRMWEGVGKLQKQVAATGKALNAKFSSDESAFEMSFGSLEVFYGGLEKLIGPPLLVGGTLLGAMRREHVECEDSEEEFTSGNGLTTYSSIEWEFVVEPVEGKVYNERAGWRDESPDKCRRATALRVFEERMEQTNAKLLSGEHSALMREEVIGGRLYSGPMYMKYNTVLRAQAKSGEYMRNLFAKLCMGNHYPTTIHAINSCVLKLSKLMCAETVWRGFSGATLPDDFFRHNEFGWAGGVELGFTSTTVEKSQAVHYSTGRTATLLNMRQGMVDRGADISWLSQYPHEREVLFPPLLGLEVLGTQVSGQTLVVEMRLSLNLVAHTTDRPKTRVMRIPIRARAAQHNYSYSLHTKHASEGSVCQPSIRFIVASHRPRAAR